MLAQKLGYLNDVSNFEIKISDVNYLIKIKKILIILINILNFVKFVMMKMIKFLLILILVLKTFMMIINYFVVSLK